LIGFGKWNNLASGGSDEYQNKVHGMQWHGAPLLLEVWRQREKRIQPVGNFFN
jgi:hypothetical protein